MQGQKLAVVFVDFVRAFDSISHVHIVDALVQKKLDDYVVKLFQSAFLDCVFSLNIDGVTSPPFKILIGVKQGDTLSPALFNLQKEKS